MLLQRLSVVTLLFAWFLAGCGSCQPGEQAGRQAAPPTGQPAQPQGAAASTPKAGAPGAPAVAPDELEVDCFVIVDAEPDFGAPPLTVNFTTETDCTGSPVTYSWDFGDGTTGGNEANPTHVYQKPGDYIATVTTKAPDGGEGSDEIDITVDASLNE